MAARIALAAAVAAALVGGPAARQPARADDARSAARGEDGPGAVARGADERGASERGARAAPEDLAEALASCAGMAEWELRRELPPGSFGALARGLEIAGAILAARPSDAIAAAMAGDPPLLRENPVVGELSSPYGVRRDPFRKHRHQRHNGVDLVADRGTPVHSAGAGRVVRARRSRGYGRVVYLDHAGGVQTRYAHLQKILVDEGDFVAAGALIGAVGSTGRATGPHLHFEVRIDGRPVEPTALAGLLAGSGAGESWGDRLAALLERLEEEGGRSASRARDRAGARRGDRAARDREDDRRTDRHREPDRERTPRSRRPAS